MVPCNGMMPDLDTFGFSSFSGFNAQLIRWRYDILGQHFAGRTCLELGSSDGQGTQFLLDRFDSVAAVDGSPKALQDLTERFGTNSALRVIESYFEDLALAERFDTVVAAHILEHVDDPTAVLDVARRHLSDDGVLIADVPNALSLHRRLGVKLGMLKDETDLNEADRSIGHRRVYTPEAFWADIERSGFDIIHRGGIFLKVLSNERTEELFDATLQTGFLDLGADLPELAAEIYVVAQKA